ncbi:hypothetical protein HELRODRAFT_191764 [Helobdella robusta]|uniref:Uncharacterized protein n=1 Tax=Helobdella robusta TaxID=6412 RepID=T1FTA7_HELRO|nr:hypothetical protein HELRODRAFT_191764 [Helobdella robusta]ESO04400.1 hypothetical protein HELRODRAFT_191764 [Helobdella robusta]
MTGVARSIDENLMQLPGREDKEKYKLFWNGKKTAKNGVGIFVKKPLAQEVLDIKRINSRLMWIKLRLEKQTMITFSAYAPQDVITRSLQSMLHIQHQQSFNLQSNKNNIAYIDEDLGKCNVEFDNILSLDKNNVRQSRNLFNNNFDPKQLQENFITTNDLRNNEEFDVAQTDLKKYNNVNSNSNLYANKMNVLELDRKLVNNSQASDALCFIQGNLLSPFYTSNEMSKSPLSPSKSSVIRIKCHPTTTMSTETSIHNCKNINKPAKKQNFVQHFQRKYITKQHNIANRINNKQTDGKLSPFQDQHQISNCPSNSDFIIKNHFKNNMKNKNKKLNNELMNNIHKITTSDKVLQNNVEPCTPSTKLTSFQNDRQQFNHFDQNMKIGTVEYGDHFRNELVQIGICFNNDIVN